METPETKAKKAKGGQNFNELTVVMYGKTYKLLDLPKTQQNNCMVYGGALKMGRSIAGMNADTYTDTERSARIDETWETLKANNWNKPGAGKREDKLKAAWDKASNSEKVILTKLGLKPKDAS
jgi:hypothetical protein